VKHAVIACFAFGLLGGCSERKSEMAVLAPIHDMFDGMAHRDAAAIKAPWSPGGVLVLVREGDLSQITIEKFAHRVATSGTTRIEERIHDPHVHIDQDLAVVWAPFNFGHRRQARSLRQGSLQSHSAERRMADRRSRCHNPEGLHREIDVPEVSPRDGRRQLPWRPDGIPIHQNFSPRATNVTGIGMLSSDFIQP
jgi:Putative lumazine-binding